MIADGETQPGAAGGRAGLGLREGREDLGQRLRLDAGAGVADLEAQARPSARVIASRTSPAAVNLIALPSRLSSTWRRCRPSRTTERGTSGLDRRRQPQPFPLGGFGDDVLEIGDQLREIGRRCPRCRAARPRSSTGRGRR